MRRSLKVIGISLVVGIASSILMGAFSAGALETSDKKVLMDYGMTQSEVENMNDNFAAMAADQIRTAPDSVKELSENEIVFNGLGGICFVEITVKLTSDPMVTDSASYSFSYRLYGTQGYVLNGPVGISFSNNLNINLEYARVNMAASVPFQPSVIDDIMYEQYGNYDVYWYDAQTIDGLSIDQLLMGGTATNSKSANSSFGYLFGIDVVNWDVTPDSWA